jgi:hypothetical protein
MDEGNSLIMFKSFTPNSYGLFEAGGGLRRCIRFWTDGARRKGPWIFLSIFCLFSINFGKLRPSRPSKEVLIPTTMADNAQSGLEKTMHECDTATRRSREAGAQLAFHRR